MFRDAWKIERIISWLDSWSWLSLLFFSRLAISPKGVAYKAVHFSKIQMLIKFHLNIEFYKNQVIL